MESKIFILTFAAFLQLEAISAQRQWVPPTTTAAEMRNPYTWYWPYAIAASESYREYYINAQQISNQLYHQASVTQAMAQQQGNNDLNSRGKGYPRWGWFGRYGRYWWHHAGKYPVNNPANPPINPPQDVPEEIPEFDY